ncbi:MAG TPA: DUF456 domain-containing protein [Smithellaceae bacterium]|nr:DUF456 domain-containing protein [Smithellaceae bacterium]
MPSLAASSFAVFILILFAGIYLSLFGLPGTAIIFIDILIYAAINGFDRIGLKVILFLLFFSIIAETIDFLLDMAGALRPSPSKKLFWISALCAIAGALILTPVLLGLGTFGGFFLGGFAAILVMELIRQSQLPAPFQASGRAIFTMIGAKMVKGCIALAMIAFSLSHIYS